MFSRKLWGAGMNVLVDGVYKDALKAGGVVCINKKYNHYK
jgi:hypothetical protein